MNGHILVIDDESSWLQMMTLLLESLQCEITTALSGKEGLNLLRSNPDKYRAVLLDLMMPEMDGKQVLEEMNDYPELSHIPVILQTGSINKEDIEAALKMGARGCLQKPFKRNDLMNVLQSLSSMRGLNLAKVC